MAISEFEATCLAVLERLRRSGVGVIALLSTELEHQDRADRFIAATAIVHELRLVTEDARLRTADDAVPTLEV